MTTIVCICPSRILGWLTVEDTTILVTNKRGNRDAGEVLGRLSVAVLRKSDV